MHEFSPQELVKKLIESGFTQAQLAERTGVSQSSLSRILNGTCDPRLSNVRAVERFYMEFADKKE
ncbi:transcriptional regulator [Xenorhabdus vietnamensis]|uniref:Transcriptional regulator n=1 Tax=Xenorhabdus vietnamensis TaxID=351656 RepID=A0A1Y2S9P7_9GAMM|nr:helix-turn-helix transcriptional regulator [Xenorhabdus vietnamensis]OTA14620.1 transcriptional regulator [Xenorhabdus vietnamensis]